MEVARRFLQSGSNLVTIGLGRIDVNVVDRCQCIAVVGLYDNMARQPAPIEMADMSQAFSCAQNSKPD